MSEELTYAASGVNIDESQRALRSVLDRIQATKTDRVVGGIGGFGALFRGSFPEMSDPMIVSSIDGVGTKTKVAAMAGVYSGLGHDIVNHCVNDILCQGARPLFFLDYYGTSKLRAEVFEAVVGGMADACYEIGCALIGGETAEMPGVYHDDEVDVIGSIVGIVDREQLLPRKVSPGDVVIGLASSGLHTNGFSLARRALFENAGYGIGDYIPGTNDTLADALLRPHKCYFNSVYPILNDPMVHAVAHLTGGGFFDNIPRVLDTTTRVQIEKRTWEPLPIFQLIQQAGNIAEAEMYRTFNMGIGMVLMVDRYAADGIVEKLNLAGDKASIIGEVSAGSSEVQLV